MSLVDYNPATLEEIQLIKRGLTQIHTGNRELNIVCALAHDIIDQIEAVQVLDPDESTSVTLFLHGRLSGCLDALRIMGHLPYALLDFSMDPDKPRKPKA